MNSGVDVRRLPPRLQPSYINLIYQYLTQCRDPRLRSNHEISIKKMSVELQSMLFARRMTDDSKWLFSLFEKFHSHDSQMEAGSYWKLEDRIIEYCLFSSFVFVLFFISLIKQRTCSIYYCYNTVWKRHMRSNYSLLSRQINLF